MFQQKPLSVLTRIILASTDKYDWIFDPFCGSSTTDIAANLYGRKFAEIEQSIEFCEISKARRQEINDLSTRGNLTNHIADLKIIWSDKSFTGMANDELTNYTLPFETDA